ncbi:DUF2141 domain-containing protein [Sphingomicrobium flavum]|uniref:DUF2141 domain-containing protein n=1 Tax=Sphingomicrobium flavum TaxID=1229164 RepID=UPI0021ADDE20|nr:DUF2141 domain-containing protein [Sphingomicrobium flavum]
MRMVKMIAGAALVAAVSPALAGDVTVTLEGVRAGAGPLYVALQTEEQFMGDASVAGTLVDNPDSDRVSVTLSDVPSGAYGLAVWHDIDRDGQFGMGPMGPTDGWAMIGGASMRGEPTFAQASFTVDEDGATLVETMIYPRKDDDRDR